MKVAKSDIIDTKTLNLSEAKSIYDVISMKQAEEVRALTKANTKSEGSSVVEAISAGRRYSRIKTILGHGRKRCLDPTFLLAV